MAWMVLMRVRTMGVSIPDGRIHRIWLDESAGNEAFVAAINAPAVTPLDFNRVRAGLCRFQALRDLANDEDASVDPDEWAIMRLLAANATDSVGCYGVGLRLNSRDEPLPLLDGNSIFDPPWEGSLEEAREILHRLSDQRRSTPRRINLTVTACRESDPLLHDPAALSGLMRLGPAGLRAMKPEPDAEPIPWKMALRDLPASMGLLASITTQELLAHAFAHAPSRVERDAGVFLEGPRSSRPSRLPEWRRAGGQPLAVDCEHLRLLDELGAGAAQPTLVPGELMETAGELRRAFTDYVIPLSENHRVEDGLRVLMRQSAIEIESMVTAGLPARIARNRNVRRNDAFRLWWLARQLAGLPAMALAFDHPWHAHNARVLAALLKAGLAGLSWVGQSGFSPRFMESALENGETEVVNPSLVAD